MANISSGGSDTKKGKPQRLNLRVDFTPMVDMNMLLITFFMFCTTLSKPQIMDIVMPTKDKDIKEEDMDKAPESKTVTLLLGDDDKVYYYWGKPDYKDYKSLTASTFSPEGGVRDILLDKNADAVQKMIELKREKRDNKRMSEDEFTEKAKKIRTDKESIVVVIKATDKSVYANLVDALDEMAICSVGKYAVVEMTDGDQYLIENLNSQGAYGAAHEEPAS